MGGQLLVIKPSLSLKLFLGCLHGKRYLSNLNWIAGMREIEFAFSPGISVALGVPIKVSMVRYLLSTPKGQVSKWSPSPWIPEIHTLFKGRSIDTLILHEQLINSMNMVIILTQVCSVLLPFESSAEPNVGQEAFCIIVQGLAVFTMVHRAIGGLGIATFR